MKYLVDPYQCVCHACQHNRRRRWRRRTKLEWLRVVVEWTWSAFILGFSAFIIVMLAR